MTGAEFSGVDIDLLADYVGGSLDGTPDEAAVAALIIEDAAWRDAHVLLSGGVAAVTEQLQALGSVAEPMPADVVARLDAALLDVAGHEESGSAAIGDRQGGATVGPVVMEPGTDGAAPARHLVAVPSGSRSKRARRLRWAAPVGIAAGVLAFVGFGVQQQFAVSGSEDTASSAGSADLPAPQAAGAPELGLPGGSVSVSESGTDYRRDTLEQAGRERVLVSPDERGESAASDFRRSVPSAGELKASSSGLDRLRAQDALRACIDAIAVELGAGEITPQAIDFARFDGAPAVIVRFTTTAVGSWVWASGPACGTDGVGADKLASVKVG